MNRWKTETALCVVLCAALLQPASLAHAAGSTPIDQLTTHAPGAAALLYSQPAAEFLQLPQPTPAPTEPAPRKAAPARNLDLKPTTSLAENGTLSSTLSSALSETVSSTASQVVSPTNVVVISSTIDLAAPAPEATAGAAATSAAAGPEESPTGALVGTIIANRTELAVRFFVEGQTYELSGLRSLGLELPRTTAVLNLFNCAAGEAASDACFWDPYLLTQDGFYEVVAGEQAGALVSLSLREAGAPPANQIWVQNRTAAPETIIVNSEVHEIPAGTIQEYTVAQEGPVIVQLRNCIRLGDQQTCEWAPRGVEAGYYYSLVEAETLGPNNTTLTSLELQALLTSSGETIKAPPQAICRLKVPTLNVRGGPGLEFPVIAKIRSTADEPGTVVVVGIDSVQQWLQVSERVAEDGWVIFDPDFIGCEGDLAALPVTALAAAPTPAPTTAPRAEPATEPAASAVAAPAVEEAAPTAAEAAAPETSPTDVAAALPDAAEAPTDAPVEAAPEITAEVTAEAPAATGIPTGLARVTVRNGFDQGVRFTLDQQYRVERDNLSGEWDLQPQESVTLLVYPGAMAFSVSTPWNGGLAGNANYTIDPDQDRVLWITFVPDPDGSGRWDLLSWNE